MPNGKHKTQEDRFKAEIEALGGEKPTIDWLRRSYMITFEYDGKRFGVHCRFGSSAVQTDHQFAEDCEIAVRKLRSIKRGAVWTEMEI